MADERGFTLLEVLVALAIAGMALTVLMGAAATALHSTRGAADYQSAMSRAKSHLAALGRIEPIAACDFEGDDGDGFHWQLRMRPVDATSLKVASASLVDVETTRLLTLYDVDVTISWMTGARVRALTLHTERLSYAGAAQP